MDDYCSCLVVELKSGAQIDEDLQGVFIFSTLSSYEYVHVILVDKDSYQIINMRESLAQNITQFLDFFDTHTPYTRSDIIFYLNRVIDIYEKNLKTAKNHLIIPSVLVN